MRIAIVTASVLPEPDTDEPLLLAELHRLGADARVEAWDDPAVPWDVYDLCVVRSTWNYHLHRDEFLAWAAGVAAVTRLANPLPVLRWNSHKGYLRNLRAAGIDIVPTRFVERGAALTLGDIAGETGWKDVVVKPAVSAASWRTRRSRPGDRESEEHLATLAADGEVLVQPYLRSVETHGERAILAIDGLVTHAVRKSPRFSGGEERVDGPVPVAPEEGILAREALRHAGEGLLYGRVDVVRDDAGRPCVMELEVLEPSLFLGFSADALQRFAKALVRQAGS